VKEVVMGFSVLVAAPIEHERGDEVYKFARLTIQDWAAFCEHIQRTRLSQISALDLPPGEKQQLYRECIRQEIDPDEMFEHAMTVVGMRWLLHRSVVQHHPKAKLGDVGDIVGGIGKMSELVVRVSDLPGLSDEDAEDDEDAEGNATKAQPTGAKS
jgi:hypothetical protein